MLRFRTDAESDDVEHDNVFFTNFRSAGALPRDPGQIGERRMSSNKKMIYKKVERFFSLEAKTVPPLFKNEFVLENFSFLRAKTF